MSYQATGSKVTNDVASESSAVVSDMGRCCFVLHALASREIIPQHTYLRHRRGPLVPLDDRGQKQMIRASRFEISLVKCVIPDF